MRRLFMPILVLLSLAPASPALAAPDPPPTNAAVYAEALSNLRHAHDFARSAQQLKYLVARDSANRDYHLALGCAEADRAVSLGYAALFTKMLDDERAKQAQFLAEWQAAQADPKSDDFSNVRPELPPLRTFVTKDDSHPFLLTQAQAAAQINALTQDARAQWTRALALSSTPALRAETEYVQGWGLQMLRLLAANNINNSDDAHKPVYEVPAPAEALRAFTAAIKDAPQNAVYWQSLGDAQYDAGTGTNNSGRANTLVSYNKSLTLQPINAPLWYRVYQMSFPVSTSLVKADPDGAQAALKHVIDSDPGNAYPHYLLAGLLFKQTHFSDPHDKSEKADQAAALTATYDSAQQAVAQDALMEVEQGNNCLRFGTILYQPPYPSLLTGYSIWANVLRASEANWVDFDKLREIARACAGYARIKAAQGDAFGLQRGARACIGMGMKMMGDWPTQDKLPGEGTLIGVLVGKAMASVGYVDLVKGEGQIGDEPGAQEAQAEYDQFQQQYKAWRAAYAANPTSPNIYDYY